MLRVQFLQTKDYKLTLQHDCNLVLTDHGKRVWSTSTRDILCKLNLQDNGLAERSDGFGNKMWSTGKAGVNGNYILLRQGDRNVVVYGPARWSTNTRSWPTSPIDRDLNADNVMLSSRVLYPGNSLKNDIWELRLECNCNLVLYENGSRVIWSSNTGGRAANSGARASICHLKMELSGNLVLYGNGGNAIWATNTKGHFSALVLQNDGNLAVYVDAIWISGTYRPSLTNDTKTNTNTTTLSVIWEGDALTVFSSIG